MLAVTRWHERHDGIHKAPEAPSLPTKVAGKRDEKAVPVKIALKADKEGKLLQPPIWEFGVITYVYGGKLFDVQLDNGTRYRLVPSFEVWPTLRADGGSSDGTSSHSGAPPQSSHVHPDPPLRKPLKPAAPKPPKTAAPMPPPSGAPAKPPTPTISLPYKTFDSSRATALTTSLPLKKRSSMGAYLPVKKRYLKGQNREESNSDESDNEKEYDFECRAEAVQQRLQRRQTQQQRRARANIGA